MQATNPTMIDLAGELDTVIRHDERNATNWVADARHLDALYGSTDTGSPHGSLLPKQREEKG